MQVYKIKHLKLFFSLNPDETVSALNEMRKRIINGEELFSLIDGKDVGVFSFTIGQNKPFVLILPGGGYGDVCSFAEGYTTAVALNQMGYNAFVGLYKVGKNAHYPNPQDSVADIVKWILANAKRLNISTDNYAVCGFSAGGHLAGMWGTKSLGYAKYGLPKPSAVLLAYPVVTMTKKAHKGSRKRLLGKEHNDANLQIAYSVERQITSDYPKTFVWQCKGDLIVSFENSLMLVDALKQNGVAYEFMPVEGRSHGLGLATGRAADGWLKKAVAFWNEE